VGYLEIGALTPDQVKQTADDIRQLQKDGAQKLVVDLRNCSIGAPEDGIAFATLFLASGRITYLKGQKVPEQDFDADPGKAITTLPLAVLVNHGTAGGAEIAAAALAGNKRAQLVGEPTYGDAALRRALTMDDGSAVILSVAKYYSPDGKAIQDTRVMRAPWWPAPSRKSSTTTTASRLPSRNRSSRSRRNWKTIRWSRRPSKSWAWLPKRSRQGSLRHQRAERSVWSRLR